MPLVIVPRWGGTATDDFYPWLIARAQRELGLETRAVVDLLPTPTAPEPIPTTERVRRALTEPASTVLLAHSVGCRAALMAARELAEPLRAICCVAGWFTVDEPWPSILPWLDDEPVRPRAERFSVIISDNDPFTADHAMTRARFEAIGADVRVIPGARHFNGREEEAVFTALRELVASP